MLESESRINELVESNLNDIAEFCKICIIYPPQVEHILPIKPCSVKMPRSWREADVIQMSSKCTQGHEPQELNIAIANYITLAFNVWNNLKSFMYSFNMIYVP